MLRHAYFTSRFTSQVGQGVFLAALVLLAGGTSTPALGFSGILAGMLAGSVLVALPAGLLIDRIGPPRALALGAALRFAAIATGFVAAGQPERAVAVAFLYSAASQVFSPAELSLVRTLSADRVGRVHVRLVALQHLGQLVGALALAPLLYRAGGTAWVLAGALAAYALVVLIAGALALRLRAAPTLVRGVRRLPAWSEAFAYFGGEHRAAYALGLLTFAEIATKTLSVALPFYLRDELHLGATQVIVLALLGGLGATAGLAWAHRALTMQRASHAIRVALAASVAATLSLAGVAGALVLLVRLSPAAPFNVATLDLSFAVAAPAALLLGICFSIAPVGARTIFSETAPPGMQGRVFATQSMSTDALVIAPLLLAGLATDAAGPRAALYFVGMLGAALFVALEWTRWRGRRELVPVPIDAA